MNGKPTKKNEVPAEKPDNSRGSYSNTIKTLTDIWNVLAAHSSAEHPLLAAPPEPAAPTVPAPVTALA